jgi:tetratricopeptide (TPR) repeat protein
VLAFLLLRALRLGSPIAFAFAAIFAVHPVSVATVSALAGRSDLLADGLLLVALALYAGAIARHPGPIVASGRESRPRTAVIELWAAWGVALLLALLGHESALILPLLAVGYEASRGTGDRGRRAATALLLGLLVAIVWAAAREGVLRGLPWELRHDPPTDYLRALDGGERLRLALYLPWFYLAMMLCLSPVLPDYAQLLARPAQAPDVVLGNPTTFGVRLPSGGEATLGTLTLVAAFALFLLLRRPRPRAAFGSWVFGIGMLFSLPLLASNGHVASSRHLLLPLLGLMLLLADLVEELLHAWRMRIRSGIGRAVVPVAAALVAAAALTLCATRTRAAHAAWSSEGMLMEHLAVAAPLSPEVPAYRGSLAMARGDLDQAAGYFEESLGRFPRNPRVLLNLGLIRAQQQQYSLAMRIFHDATVVSDRIMPNSSVAAKAHLGLGTLLGWQSLDDAALEEFHKALAADSMNVTAMASAGVIEAMSYATAPIGIRRLSRALQLDPEGRELGTMAKRVREVRDRAVLNVARIAEGRDAYESGMHRPDSASAQSGTSRREKE